MNEQSFLERLRATPGNQELLREYAEWLITRDDPRGTHLAAELDVCDAEERLVQAEQQLACYRGTRHQDFDWLNTVRPMTTTVSVNGIFYLSLEPDGPPCVKLGSFCDRNTVVGIVESQKVFYHIPAGHSGVVTDVFVENGASVAAGDPIVQLIRPQKSPIAVSAR